jgi:hypothetical protein
LTYSSKRVKKPLPEYLENKNTSYTQICIHGKIILKCVFKETMLECGVNAAASG